MARLLSNEDDVLASARLALAHNLRSRAAEMYDAVLAHVRGAVPDPGSGEDARPAAGLREAIVACVDCGLASVEQGGRWSGPIPPAVATQARWDASSDVGLTTSLQRAGAGYTFVWSLILGEVAGSDLPDEQKFALLLQVSGATTSLFTRIQAEIAETHASTMVGRARSHEQRRADIVHRLLAEEQLGAGELAELGYELDRWHIGLIATGTQSARHVRSLAAEIGCDVLAIAHGQDTVWAWLGGRRRLGFTDIERVLSAEENTDLLLTVGEPARGLSGWRQTYREAESAMLVARCWPRRLTRYLDVAPYATALQDDALADSLIDTYLSPLDNMRIGGQAARRILGALLDKAHNVSSAAAALNIDRSTVHRQRNNIERQLGCRVHERQVEIALALGVEDLRQRHRDAESPANEHTCC